MRGRPTVITPNSEKYIKKYYERMTIAEMARNLNISFGAVHSYMIANQLKKEVRKPGARKVSKGIPADCFNVYERENWLV